MQPDIIYLAAGIDGLQNILLDCTDDRTVIETGRTFKMQKEGTEVHIDRSDNRGIIIGNNTFRMQEAGPVLVNLHACTVQLLDTQDGSVVLWAAADPEESCQIKVTEVRAGAST